MALQTVQAELKARDPATPQAAVTGERCERPTRPNTGRRLIEVLGSLPKKARALRSPVVRISLGLVMLTTSILLFGQFFGLAPDAQRAQLEARKAITESLAIQLSWLILQNDKPLVQAVLAAIVDRNTEIASSGVRRAADGTLIAQAGEHSNNWTRRNTDKSTASEIIVPVYDGQQRWGSIEVRFHGGGTTEILGVGSFPLLILFVVGCGLVGYPIFLTRVLRALNPDAVVPSRVKVALNTLSEGVLVLDDQERIVFSNDAFASKTGLSVSELTGRPVSELGWELSAPADGGRLPWQTILESGENPGAVRLELKTPLLENYILVVNASPIFGAGNTIRGVLATFDDITELDARNSALQDALDRLESSEQEIRRQNHELQLLATRDPLTGSLNRRSLFEGFDSLVEQAREENTPLCCVMVDIDHFKSINDRFGHSIGDKVIVSLARALKEETGNADLVARYGGEEFCVVMPATGAEQAMANTERLRSLVERGSANNTLSDLRVTASFGVAEFSPDTADARALLDRADQALYVAKETGRNRVCLWSEQRTAGENVKPAALNEPAPLFKDKVAAPITQPIADMERGRLEQKIRELTAALKLQTTDANTGLPNRTLLLDRIAQATHRATRDETHLAILAVRIDALAPVSDTLGHPAAEKLILLVAARIREMLRKSDSVGLVDEASGDFSVARLESDMLAVLLTDVDNAATVHRIVERLFSAFDRPVQLDGAAIKTNCMIGISVFPNDGQDAQTILRQSVAAMRQADTDGGKSQFRFYSQEIEKRARKRIELETDLHQAIGRGEFQVHYQPKVDLRTGDISGMEALVRWQHPRRGLVMPGEFIQVAEEIGIIEDIGRLILASACRQARVWLESGLGPIPIAVNLSPNQFQNGELAARVLGEIATSGTDPRLLELEITESIVMQNVEFAVAEMNRLAAAGVAITIDDFGTGYSSLSCMREFPISKFKIDRSFMLDVCESSDDASVVSGIIAMGHTMGLEVVAEGVETEQQLQLLRDLNCDVAQGYFFARPLPRDQATKFIEEANTLRERVLASYRRGHSLLPASPQQVPEILGLLNEPRRS